MDPSLIESQDDPYYQPPLRPLTPGVAPPGLPGASMGDGGFQPGQGNLWSPWWQRQGTSDYQGFNPQLTSSGASGMGTSGQPQADTSTSSPTAGAGAILGGASPSPASSPVEGGGRMAPPPSIVGNLPTNRPVAATPGALDQVPLATTGGDALAEARDAALARMNAAGQAMSGGPGGSWGQRLAMALLSMTKLAPYANQIVHPKYMAQYAQYAQAAKDVEGLTSAEAEQQRGQYYQGLESGRQEEREITARGREQVAQVQAAERATAAQGAQAEASQKRLQAAHAALTKGRTIIYRDSSQPGPPGWEKIPITDPSLPPGLSEYAPPAIAPLPKELVPFLPGHNEGDLIDAGSLEEAGKAYRSTLTQKLKPEQLNAVGLAIRAAGGDPSNPSSVTPQIAAAATARLKPEMPGISLTPEAVQFWAQAAAQGVPLPSMGMGASGAAAREKIINAAPEAAGGTPLVEARATTRADMNSLANMTRTRDAVAAFENTAGKNLDLFLQTAKPVVDSGSPWVNTPLRAVSQQGLGSPDLAAYNTARQVALTEIAKVVNNPSMSSVLSDSARKEVTSLVPENATLGQIYRIAGVLRQDMANRKSSLNDSIQGIQSRLHQAPGGLGGPGGPGGPPIVQHSPSTRAYRYSLDGGKSWQPGQPPSR